MRFGTVLATVVLLAGLALTGLVGCNAAAPAPNIDATVAAKVQATLAAAPTQTPLPTYTPYPTATPAATYTPETPVDTDRAALVALYHATGGPEWTNNRLWLNEREPLDSWYGVATNSEGRVTELELGFPGGNNLTGHIPAELGSLSELKRLDLTPGTS